MPPFTYSSLITTLGGRRFLLALLSLLSITCLNAYGTLDSTAFAASLAATVATYVAGNTAQKIKQGARSGEPESK